MRGMDICYKQGNINFEKAKADGIEFIIPREGWGVDCDGKEVDPAFFRYVTEAQASGIDVPGVYHFIYAHDEATARENAACAINNVRKAGLPKTTVIWCDQEEDTVIDAVKHGYNVTTDMQRKITEAFCDYILEQGYSTGVYLNRDYIIRVYGEDILTKYNIWLVDLSGGEPYCDCVYRQYDWFGRVSGCPTNVDMDLYIGKYTQKGSDSLKHRIVYTEKELVEILKKLARSKSSYKAKYPWNLLYWDGTRWWADCSNLYKALFNGRSIVNPAVGSYQADLSNTGDCTEWGLMEQCTDRSTDFRTLGDHFECLYMDGHFGGYLGEEWDEPGQGIVNCVECTPRWEDGIQFSYVDEQGRRFWAKGKDRYGTWECHGKATPWISYSDDVQPKPTVTTIPLDTFISYLKVVKKGDTGEAVYLLQECLRNLGFYSDSLDGSAGPNTERAIKAYQSAAGLSVDGVFGPKSWTALLRG